MPKELTFASWKAEVDKKVKPLAKMTPEFFAAYKQYILHEGATRFIKGSNHADHIRKRDAAEAAMERINSDFDTQRAKNKAHTVYTPWSKQASAETRRKATAAEKKKPKTDMGGQGGQDAVNYASGSSRRSTGRKTDS